ncbi:1-acyl-sn-glycerol-3-phosphate acyltransferase [Sphingomonas ginkgonis]|uniref:1-acyl-sn-glycerol-3-phosphate acyltransferase n=1 Tax=Sphingomonas ginkgonis TaxID=2315330 RepID=A0A429VCH1_9SPHN|nr:lysophospholipid acyltransferase family protein [Sphingomonas ginkgonis]RST31689.1 1-acyl-sn-glycerol-3-phosphate acyltransferase [Sphingomonas ginkgonis]
MNGRALLRVAALVGWFAVAAPLHLLTRATGRSRWPRRFLRVATRIMGARLTVEGAPLAPGTLIVANHTSWLDIPLLAGATGCAFVSKQEVRGHPLLRWLADQNATIYVDRSDRRGMPAQAQAIRAGLARGQALAIFPEATTGDGGTLLPFKPALLSAVAPPPDGVTVRPVAVDYNGAAPEFGWHGDETGKDNARRVLGRRGSVPVTVRLLDPLPPLKDRKALAGMARDAIAAALAPSGVAPAGL